MGSQNLEQEINLEKKACTKLFELAKDYLTKLSYYESFISDLSSGEEESLDFLSSSFSLLRELGKLADNKSDEIEALVSRYKLRIQQTNKSFDAKKFDKLFATEYKGEKEWIDELNYIHIWTLNSYQLNLKNFNINGDKNILNNPELELELKDLEEQDQAEKQLKKKKRSDWNKNGFAIYRNILSSKFNFGDENQDSEDGFEHIVSRTQAIERLERDIRGGKIYIYHSKPIRNLKLKKILSYLFLAGLIVSGFFFLITCIGCISNGGSDHNQSILFSIMSFIFFLLARNENNKYLDNENFKYAFSRKIFYYFFFLSSFFVFNRSNYFFSNVGTDTLQHVILGILLFLLIVSVTFFTVAYFFLNPKKNKALIKGLLQKYTNSPNLYQLD